MDVVLPKLLLVAWLMPLASFAVISIAYSVPQFLGVKVRYATQKYAAYLAIGAIVGGFVLSCIGLFGYWLPAHSLHAASHAEGESEGAGEHALATPQPIGKNSVRLVAFDAEERLEDHSAASGIQHAEGSRAEHNNGPPPSMTGDWYVLGIFGSLRLTIGYYIDTLTVVMFAMVTLIASCVHIYAFGYMHDELHDYTDHEVKLADGHHLHRPGRFHRFFQYLSLFSFSMLGICISGNLAMTFVFWELVGICSYFLIGFYIERHSASTAANKAFIVNRVGDFGMLIGLMAIWTTMGTFNFGDMPGENGATQAGIFSQLHQAENNYKIAPTDGMIAFEGRNRIAEAVRNAGTTEPAAMQAAAATEVARLRADEPAKWGHWVLFIAGVGIFCGCVGKSAQFPLHVWLPDAMEGPTPVSALVHSATMVAAGVFLVGRVYPLFSAEALLVIAVVGCITLFIAATIAVTQMDIKRVLAYSTVSQLGFMMLALGLGGWLAGLFHLITHAFFKSLMFLCSGSVIHAVHSNDMRQMGGLRKKMPVTAYTMLVGCLAIAGVGVPFLAGFSGFHSKDAIVEQAMSHWHHNARSGVSWLLFVVPVFSAALTAFYMFRLWYMTFAGEPRDHHRYDHAHESPRVMTGPLVLLSVFAVCAGWGLPAFMPGPLANFSIPNLLEQARPVGTLISKPGVYLSGLLIADEHIAHEPEMFRAIKMPAGIAAISAALLGIWLATEVYLWRRLSAEKLGNALRPLYQLSWHKWWFDELYDLVFVRPTHAVSGFIAAMLDRGLIDGIIHTLAWLFRGFAVMVSVLGDRLVIDNSVDGFAEKTWNFGLSLRSLQTGRLRQYVMFLVVATVVLFLVAGFWKLALAG
ncbi:MAG: NADH-quinone oxidoreductase subunit L [Pirellulales bacterium]|nr:NADH-quinone oxidoreductase subunit L [Pirellulales bacterium]